MATDHRSDDCRAISDILNRVGDKWTVLVVMLLGDGPLRFGELRDRIGGISHKMLAATLRALERDGFVTRTVTPTIPPRVDYELTPLGRELQGPVQTLGQWARGNIDRVLQARLRYDGRDGGQDGAPERDASVSQRGGLAGSGGFSPSPSAAKSSS